MLLHLTIPLVLLQILNPVAPTDRQDLLRTREAVWRAWFSNDQAALERLIPEGTIGINAGEEAWLDRQQILNSARTFSNGGARLAKLSFPRTEVQRYGNVAILYSLYSYELDERGQKTTYGGRTTEVFVRTSKGWVNSGWHIDSGK